MFQLLGILQAKKNNQGFFHLILLMQKRLAKLHQRVAARRLKVDEWSHNGWFWKFLSIKYLRQISVLGTIRVGFIYTFRYSLSSTSSTLEQWFQSVHHLQMTSSEVFQHYFSIISKFVCCDFYMKECSFYTNLFCCTEMT